MDIFALGNARRPNKRIALLIARRRFQPHQYGPSRCRPCPSLASPHRLEAARSESLRGIPAIKRCHARCFGFSRRVFARHAPQKFLKNDNGRQLENLSCRKLPADKQNGAHMNWSKFSFAMLRAASLAGVASIFVVSAWGANAQGNDDRSGNGDVRSETLRIPNTIHPIVVARNDHKQRHPYPVRVGIGHPLPPQPLPASAYRQPLHLHSAPAAPTLVGR